MPVRRSAARLDRMPETTETAKCPFCGSTDTECLEQLSRASWVDYHLCKECRQTWSIPRAIDEAPCETPA